ncbi:MAG: TauD/TfdA family dioxygenase [Alphaproteobacteria bacterium]|nr:TauD/TfdA family dioxygenase [Alphaproteobacteria bacterium]
MPIGSHGLSAARPPVTAQGVAAGPTVSQMPGGLGAACTGIDLSLPIAAPARDAIIAAFQTHHVLAIRDQRLSKTNLSDFAAIFGEVEGNIFRKTDGSLLEAVHEITNFGADGKPSAEPYLKSNFNWHTDKAYQAVPSLLTMLHAVELPPSGGDTQFADMTRAYDALPDDLKTEIAGLKVVHSFEHMRVSTGDRPLTPAEREASPPVIHPLVRTHPDTGARSLYIGMYCSHILGMEAAASRALLDRLLAHATQPHFVYTHEWRPGDLVLWDNRCLVHRAVANYELGRYRRVLMRVVVKGTVPV